VWGGVTMGGKGDGGVGNPDKGLFGHHKWPSLAEPLEMRGEFMSALCCMARASIYLLYSYKSTNTNAEDAARGVGFVVQRGQE
jgi:hypothetical protein